MVSSYLICDVCGQFGPPASFLSQDGLRLCYQCWHREQQENALGTVSNTPDSMPDSSDPEKDEPGCENRNGLD